MTSPESDNEKKVEATLARMIPHDYMLELKRLAAIERVGLREMICKSIDLELWLQEKIYKGLRVLTVNQNKTKYIEHTFHRGGFDD